MEQKDEEIGLKQQELLEIIASILSELKIKSKAKTQLSFKDAIKKINLFKMDKQEKDLNHLLFFVRQLFLDEKGNLDFNPNELEKYISEKAINTIFDSLLQSIKSKDFLYFLLQLGEIFSAEYFEQESLIEFVKDYENKGINNYELLFIFFSESKKRKDTKYIMDNYVQYFSDTYSIEIAYNLILSMDIYINLCLSSPDFNNYEDYLNEEESTNDNSLDKSNVINEYEKFILKSLKTFLVNSQCLFSVDLSDFMTAFYEFILQDGSLNLITGNNKDNVMKIYLDYMLPHIKKLFRDFNIESLKEFNRKLYDFVEKHKDENIDFVKRAKSIQNSHDLTNEEIGFISLICANKKVIKNFQAIVDSNQDCDLEKLKDIVGTEGMSDSEIFILESIHIERKNQMKQNKTQNNNNEEEEKKEIQPENEIKEENFSDDPKYQQIMNYVNSKISEVNLKYENVVSNLKEKDKEISDLNEKVEKLTDMHKRIYFRDVSKYYINRFDKLYKFGGNNTYDICQNILDYEFSNSPAKDLKDIIIKIANHYLQGNKAAHIEYFISHSKYKNKKMELIKDMEKSYMDFMGFKENEKQLLDKKFKIAYAPFIYYHHFG